MPLELVVAAILAMALLVYALTGGADYGGGVWDLLATGPRASEQREAISKAIGPMGGEPRLAHRRRGDPVRGVSLCVRGRLHSSAHPAVPHAHRRHPARLGARVPRLRPAHEQKGRRGELPALDLGVRCGQRDHPHHARGDAGGRGERWRAADPRWRARDRLRLWLAAALSAGDGAHDVGPVLVSGRHLPGAGQRARAAGRLPGAGLGVGRGRCPSCCPPPWPASPR